VLVEAWGLGSVPEMWDTERGLADMGAVVVVAVGRCWDLVASKDVGVVPGGWGLIGLVEGWSRFAAGIFLLWRCLRTSGCSRWSQVGLWAVAEAGMCLLVAIEMTSLMVFVRDCEVVNIREGCLL
jgi:hypothetical protein